MALLNLSHRCFLWLATVAFISLMLTTQYASADVGDTLNVTVGSTLMYDTNVFRVSPNVPIGSFVPGATTGSDQIITSTATLGLNKLYGMQRFEVNGSIVDNRYHNFNFLDFIGKNYTAAWHWYLTPYLHGKISSDHKEALNNFADLTGFINSNNRNLRTNDNQRFDGVFEISRALHLVGSVSETTLKNSRLTVQDFDNRVLSADGGIRYIFPAGSSLTYRVRSGQGDFFKRPEPISASLFDTRFHDLEHGLQLIWPVTIKTSIDARVGHFERKHAHFSERNFAGFIGHLNVNWAITSKTRVTASWAREISNFQTAANFQLSSSLFQRYSSSYAIVNRFSLAPIWQITEKVVLRLRYDYITRDFLGAVVSFPEDRSDSMHSGLISLEWQPLRALLVTSSLQRDHRSSNLSGFGFDSAAASVTARLNF